MQSPGEAPREVMVVRYAIQGNVPIDARLVSTSDGSKIGYIFIPSFFDETIPEQIENALNEFGPLDGLILDLRMNGGGSSSVTYPILEYFIDGELGDFVSRRDSRTLEIDANEIQNSQTVPLVVLVGEDTASFGEIFAGVMQDSGRARIVGETSLGNGLLLCTRHHRLVHEGGFRVISDGDQVRFLRPDGRELLVSNHVSDSVSVIDTNSASASYGQVIETIQELDVPGADPDARVHASTRFDEPVGIAFDPAKVEGELKKIYEG